MDGEKSMREVVERLRAEGSEAVLELLEFDHALEALLQNLEDVGPTFQGLHLATTKLVGSGNEDVLRTVKDQTSPLGMWHSQFLAAFQELQSAVREWSISDGRNRSGLPSSGRGERKD